MMILFLVLILKSKFYVSDNISMGFINLSK